MRVEIYTTPWCPYCVAARELLIAHGVGFEEIDVSGDPALRQAAIERGGGHTVPQIFIDGQPVGGYDELRALEAEGRLDALRDADDDG